MYTPEEIDLIILSSFSELTYSVKRKLLCDFENTRPDFEAHENFLIKTLPRGVYNKVKADFYDGAYREKYLASLEKKGVVCVTYFSESYPESLKNIYDAPIVLFCKGDISLLKSDCFSVVGSRKTSPKALAECEKISGELSKVFTVVTGLAVGADSAAVNGALKAGGKVISVLAHGLDSAYPACNANLLNKVVESGLAVSEYSPEVKPMPFYFPVRNRIIAGLSKGTLVVSAGKKSGALITANLAAEYGRDVFAFPYSAGIYSGEGCNALIKNGAYLTENILDILSAFSLDFNSPTVELTQDEKALLEAIKTAGEAFIPKIAEEMGKLSYELIPAVSSLEIKGLIVRLGGNRYSAI